MHGYANDHGVIVHVSILQQTHKTHETFMEFHGTMQRIAFKRSSILIFHLHDWRVNISSIPNYPKKPRNVQVVSIHQTDSALMERGIYGLGGFLKVAKELRVLWSPPYLSRLWSA